MLLLSALTIIIWYDGLNASFSGAIVSDVSDHYSVFVVLNIVNNNGTFTHQFRDHSKNNVDLFIGDVDGLRDSYFAQCTDRDSNFKTEWFVNNLWELYCRRCPSRIKTLSVKRYLKPWVTRNIQRMINYKHTLFKRYKQAAIPLEFYNRYKNNVSRILKESKSNYFSNKFEQCQSNLKSTWLTINSVLGHKRKKSNNITLLDSGGDEFSDSQRVADASCDYFSTVATTLDSNIPTTGTDPMYYMPDPLPVSFFATRSSNPRCTQVYYRTPQQIWKYSLHTSLYLQTYFSSYFTYHM